MDIKMYNTNKRIINFHSKLYTIYLDLLNAEQKVNIILFKTNNEITVVTLKCFQFTNLQKTDFVIIL